MKSNKLSNKIILLIAVFLLVVSAWLVLQDTARAQINPMINFSGKVTETDGTELADGTYDFRFRLYDARTGGNLLWQEELDASTRFSGTISGVNQGASGVTYDYTGGSATSTLRLGQYLSNATSGEAALITDYDTAAGTITVASGSPVWSAGETVNNRPYVEGGIVDINLGSVGDLSGVDLNQQLYLEVTFNGETMQPRKLLTSVPQAFESARLGGRSADEYAALDENEAITGEWSFQNIVDIATTSDVTALTITQNGSGNIMEVRQGASTSFAVLDNGQVQIGEYTFPSSQGAPGYVLKTDLNGDLYWDPDIAGTGGGSGLWATSSGDTFIYQADAGQSVVLGNNTMTDTSYQLEVSGPTLMDRLDIAGQNEIRFYDADGSNYAALRATSTMAENFTLNLPADFGSAGQALILNDAGNLVWGSPSSFTYVTSGSRGQLPYYAADGSQLTGTSSLFLDTFGNFGIGTTAPSAALTVGGVSGNQFLVDANGNVLGGTWQGNVVGEAYGGTGTSTYAVGDLLYSDAIDSLARLPAGDAGDILAISGGVPAWLATSSLNIGSGNIVGMIGTSQGGTGQDFSSATGFIYLDSGVASASSTVAITHTDLQAASGLNLNANILSLDNTGNWAGTFDGLEGSELFTLSAWQATTTDALAEGAVNLYWTDRRFDIRLSSTTTLPNLTSLPNLSEVGTVATGTWQGSVISERYGGTGISTYSQGDILYSGAADSLGRLPIGGEGEILTVSPAGVPAWVSTSSLNIDAANMTGILDTAHGGTGQDFSSATGFVYLDNGLALASSTIAITYTDLAAGSGIDLDSNIISLDNTGDWLGTLDGYEGDDFFTLSAWYGTTTAPQLMNLENLSTVGTITTGAWQAGLIGPSYGGTGTSTAGWTGLPFVDSGTWVSTTTLSSVYGGTGFSSYATGDILFAGTANALARLGIGSEGEILTVSPSGLPNWVATSSLNIDAGNMTGVMDTEHGGTGQDFSSATGFIYLDSGLASASSTIAISHTDLTDDNTGVELNGNVLSLDTSGDWSGTLDGYEGGDFFTLTAWYATTTDALAEGSINRYYDTSLFASDLVATTTDALSEGSNNLYWTQTRFDNAFDSKTTDDLDEGASNLYWTDARFDARLSATTSLPNILELENLNTVGTVTSGTWQADVIDVAYGGTGISSIADQSLLYGASANVIGEFAIGSEGEVLVVQGGQLTWATSSPAASHGLLSVTHSDVEATSTLSRGDIMAVNSDGRWSRLGLGPAGYILYSDGNDAAWATTTNITALGTVTAGRWQGEPIELGFGGTGATTATGARENLGLEEVYKFGVNSTGTQGQVWQSDGDGRGQWVSTSSLGIASGGSGVATFVGTTTATSDGSISHGGFNGYAAANSMCEAEYTGSFFCRTYDIIATVEDGDISGWGTGNSDAWVAEGPPGYTVNSNDCLGWTDNTTDYLGAFWKFDQNGGSGWMINCAQTKPLACCAWQ